MNEIFNVALFEDGYMSSPERGTRAYEEPYYTQYGTRGSSVTPIIDEEQRQEKFTEFLNLFLILILIFFINLVIQC